MVSDRNIPAKGTRRLHVAEEDVLTAVGGLLLCLIVFAVHGVIPGVQAPTTAQVIWMAGFAESFIHDGFSIYAHNIGLPKPAPISFGLSAALPMAGLLALGVNFIVAYSAAFAAWLAIAFWGAFGFARSLRVDRASSLCCALLWCTFPIVWIHHIFSALALGIALLPTYLLAARLVVERQPTILLATVFVASCWIAVFMDGYTFMMSATGALIFWIGSEPWRGIDRTLFIRAAVLGFGFGSAYAAYAFYEGVAGFEGASLTFFAGWGASIEFFLVPTTGVLALPDMVGLSAARKDINYFGDASTHLGAFCGGLLLVVILCLSTRKVERRNAFLFCAIAFIGIYLSLGPTLKFLTYRPSGVGPLMPLEYGRFPTGSALVAHLPGFKSMRASYRWTALGMFGLWGLLVAAIGSGRLSIRYQSAIILSLLALNIPKGFLSPLDPGYKEQVEAISTESSSWKAFFRPGETVVFLPFGNDFLLNLAANQLQIRTFNIGGDKNMFGAVAEWPEPLKAFRYNEIAPQFQSNVERVLSTRTADAVVFPYISFLRAAHSWPQPDERKAELEPIARKIAADPRYEVTFAPHFAVIRLKK